MPPVCSAAHLAAQGGHKEALLSLAGASIATLLVPSDIGWLPLHSACEFDTPGQLAVLRLLLSCFPRAAEVRSHDGQLPIHVALYHGHIGAARCLLRYAPSSIVLRALWDAGAPAAPLFGDFVRAPGRLPLSSADWSEVPQPCASLQRALPAALTHSTDQASLLVRGLPVSMQRRLRTFALVLVRLQRRLRLQLPALLVQHLLSLTFDA